MSKKAKRTVVCIALTTAIILAAALAYPHIEFKAGGKLYACRYSEDFSEFEENSAYNELYFYNERHDVSLKNFTAGHFLCFYVLSFDYVEGDVREAQFMLEESFVTYWLDNADILLNDAGVDVASLIRGKTAVVGNTRYSADGDTVGIDYILDGKEDTLYIYESDGLTVLRVGSSDESPRYIAYK